MDRAQSIFKKYLLFWRLFEVFIKNPPYTALLWLHREEPCPYATAGCSLSTAAKPSSVGQLPVSTALYAEKLTLFSLILCLQYSTASIGCQDPKKEKSIAEMLFSVD